MKNTSQTTTFKPLEGGTFKFACHPGVSCFTQCCAKLRLLLTPYDILRIKRRLGLDSERFLDQYAESVFEPGIVFPMVLLKMNSQDGYCPFLTSKGCSIYEDRPGACRLYPIGRASAFPTGGDRAREKFFIVTEDHCQGFREDRLWTIDEWLNHEGMYLYNKMNDPWTRIVTSNKPLGPENTLPQKLKMFFMASYNLDRFRQFLFHSPFFEKFYVEGDIRLKLARDDEALMNFAFDWLRFALFGEKTLTPRIDKSVPFGA